MKNYKKVLILLIVFTISLFVLSPILPKIEASMFDICVNGTLCLDKKTALPGGADWIESVTAAPGGYVNFNVGIDNRGTTPITNLVVKDILPAQLQWDGATFIKYDDTGAHPMNGAAFFTNGINFGTLNPGKSIQIVYKVLVVSNYNIGSFTFTNRAIISADNIDSREDSAAVRVTYSYPADSGLRGQYFNNKDFYGTPDLVRIDPTIDSLNPALTWPTLGSPDSRINIDNFSVLWTGQVKTDFAGNYTFYTNSDDGIRLWIDNNLLIDKWFDRAQPNPHDNATVNLNAGWHNIRVEYYEHGGGAVSQVSWSNANQTAGVEQIIPRQNLRQTHTGNITEGLQGEYFDNIDFIGTPKATKIDKAINFNWDNISPVASVGPNNYAVKWTGRIRTDFAQTYTFCTRVDDGSNLWIDDTLVISNWLPGGLRQVCGNINLTAGWHNIRLDYLQRYASSAIYLTWNSASQTGGVQSNIPSDHLDPNYSGTINPGLTAEYFNNPNLTGSPTLVRTDQYVNFDWYISSPAPTINANDFSIRWNAFLNVPVTGNYTFVAQSDDGIRVFVDGIAVINNWQKQGLTKVTSLPINLTAGRHSIRVEYFDSKEAAGVFLRWITPTNPVETVITPGYFTH